MKRKITYYSVTLLLAAGIYCFLRFAFGIFTPYNYFSAGTDTKNGKIQIIEYGEMMLNFEKQQQLANSYGFSFHSIGCMVDRDEMNGIKYYNRKMISYLEKNHGVGWWERFEKQIDSTNNITIKERIESEVLSLIENQEPVKDIIKQTDSLSKGNRHIVLIPALYDTANKIYLVKVAEDNGTNFVSYFNYWVDADSMKIINKPIQK